MNSNNAVKEWIQIMDTIMNSKNGLKE